MLSVGAAPAHAQSAGPQEAHPQTHSAAHRYARHQRQLSTPSAFGPSYALMSAVMATPSHMQHQRHQSVDGGAAGSVYGASAAGGQPAFLQPQPYIGRTPFNHAMNALTGTPPLARAMNMQQAAVDHGRNLHFLAAAAPLYPQGMDLAHVFPRPPMAGSQLSPAHSISAAVMGVPGGHPAAHQEPAALHQMVPSTPTRQCRQGNGMATPRMTPGTMTPGVMSPTRGPDVGARSFNLLSGQPPVVLAPTTQTPRKASPCRVAKKASPQKRTGSPSKKRPAGHPPLPASLLKEIADQIAADGTPIPNLASSSGAAGVGLPMAAHAAPLSISPPRMGALSTPQASAVSTPSTHRSDDPFVFSPPGAIAAAPPLLPILSPLGAGNFKDPFAQGAGMLRTPQASLQSSPAMLPLEQAPSFTADTLPRGALQPVPEDGDAMAQPDGSQAAATTAANPTAAKSPPVLDLEAARISKGFTLEHIDSYIEGPDANGNFRCLFRGCMHVVGRQENARCHVQTHIGDRQFVCMVCNKDFVRKNDLKRHFTIHAEEKPHLCPCGKMFSRLDALNRHRNRNLCIGGEKGIVVKEVKRGRKPKKAQPENGEEQQNSQHASQHGVAMSATSSSSGLSEASSHASPQETVSGGESQSPPTYFYSPVVSPEDEPGAQSAAEQMVKETATAQHNVTGISAAPRPSAEYSMGSSSHATERAPSTQPANQEIFDNMSPTFDDEMDTQIPLPAGFEEFLGPALDEISEARGGFEGLSGAGFDASAMCAELDRELLRSAGYDNSPAVVAKETSASSGAEAEVERTSAQANEHHRHQNHFFDENGNFDSEQLRQGNAQARRPPSPPTVSSFSSSSSSTCSSSSSSHAEHVNAAAAPQAGSDGIDNGVCMDGFFEDDSLFGGAEDLSPSAPLFPSSQISSPSPAPQASSAAQHQSTNRQLTPEEMAEMDFDEKLKRLCSRGGNIYNMPWGAV